MDRRGGDFCSAPPSSRTLLASSFRLTPMKQGAKKKKVSMNTDELSDDEEYDKVPPPRTCPSRLRPARTLPAWCLGFCHVVTKPDPLRKRRSQ